MNFIIEMPRISKQHNAIMVMVDKLSKVAHFVAIKSTYKEINIAQIFMKEIFILHGMPMNIISDRDDKFTSNFWKVLFSSFRIELAFSTVYHPQTNGHTKSFNRVMEDMLRMYVMHQPKRWEEFLPLVEFSYNNVYQKSSKMSPVNMVFPGNNMLKETE